MQALCGGDRLAMLLEQAFLTRDELLFKVLRNLSQQSDVTIKTGFLPYMDQLIALLQVPSLTSAASPATRCITLLTQWLSLTRCFGKSKSIRLLTLLWLLMLKDKSTCSS